MKWSFPTIVVCVSSLLCLGGCSQRPPDPRAAIVGKYQLSWGRNSFCSEHEVESSTLFDYAATKAAVDAFTIGLAKEVASEGIRVNAVRPGIIHTEIHASGGDANRVERVKNSIPMRRGGLPEEVANAILWLVSDEASYCAGAFINVSGGR